MNRLAGVGLGLVLAAVVTAVVVASRRHPVPAGPPSTSTADAEAMPRAVGDHRQATVAAIAEADHPHSLAKPDPDAFQPGPLGDELFSLKTEDDYYAAHARLADKLTTEVADPTRLGKAVADPVTFAGLAQYELLRVCGPAKLADIAGQDGGGAFLRVLLGNPRWMESFLLSDPPAESFPQALENLYLLHRHGKDLDRPVYRRLATALALQAGKLLPYRLVDRFGHVQRAHRALLLHAGFDTMDVREMRWAVYLGGDAADYQYLLDDRQNTIGDYFGACWACWYRGENDFGDSIQGPWYHLPWRHAHPNWEVARRVGGVCGTLSTYGASAARAHGVMSTPVGQPGHCAYVIRVDDEWPVAYDVTWPTGFTAPGWDGTGYATATRLYEPVHRDRERFRTASHLTWVARLLVDRAQARARLLPGLRYRLYRQGVGAALPDFSRLEPDRTGQARAVDLVAVTPSPPHRFGVVWDGEIEVAGPGALRVSARSDDSSRVLIAGRPVVSACCDRKESEVRLTPGRHALRVEFSQGEGALHLAVEFNGVPRPGPWTEVYEQAIRAQPLNYRVWLEYLRTLERCADVPAKTWLDLARRAATIFAPYQEAAWGLVHRLFEKASPGMTPAERLAFLVECHRELRQKRADRFVTFPYQGVLAWQADRLGGDADLALRFFGSLMQLHAARPPHDWTFGQVLAWGQDRFANHPRTSVLHARTLQSWFLEQGAALNLDLVRSQVQGGLRRAGETGDQACYRLWCQTAEKLLPPLQPADLHLTPRQAAEFPQFKPFAGDVLSRDGLVRISSVDGGDRPLSYPALVSPGGIGGFFHTGGEDNPWVQVQLPGEGELSGVILINRFEACRERAVPLQVSVSSDGKTWKEVATFHQVEPVFRVDLNGKHLRARFVRAERLRAPERRDPFHLRAVLVYGRRIP